MKIPITALALATLIAVPAFTQPVVAASQSRHDSSQSRHDSDGSWQCYPYCDGGTYEGRPVREWMKPDGW
jgi:hypothetical protein